MSREKYRDTGTVPGKIRDFGVSREKVSREKSVSREKCPGFYSVPAFFPGFHSVPFFFFPEFHSVPGLVRSDPDSCFVSRVGYTETTLPIKIV